MNFLRRWWWPLFTFLYPFLFYPTLNRDLQWDYAVHAAFTAFFLVVGAFLEALAHPQTRLHHLPRLGGWLWRRPVLLLAWLYALWALISTRFAVSPGFALTGSPEGLGDGALWVLALVGVATLVALRAEEDPAVLPLVLRALLLAGGLLTLLAFFEVATHKRVAGTLTGVLDPSVLPQVNFGSKGHLGGFLGLALGVALGSAWGVLALLLGFGVGLTYNRASLVGLLLALGSAWAGKGTRALRVFFLAFLGLLLGLGATRLWLPSGAKALASPSSLEQRYYGWKATLRGIAARPLFGFGAAGFHFQWPLYLEEEELRHFLRIMWGAEEVLSRGTNGQGMPVFLIRDQEGQVRLLAVQGFKAHNEFLDQALLFGLPGAFLWLLLYLLALRQTWATPLGGGLLAYFGFLLFWYAVFYALGVLWVLLGLAATQKTPLRRIPTP
ncbi:hypothetical protein [Thermus scotoductus]|uniref:hypothetical protein n=1 Tax=Thermus scotoductus TaxID=37636 RepID=UPI000365FF50|nr:hypothetical protein [Thermus scotoductus]